MWRRTSSALPQLATRSSRTGVTIGQLRFHTMEAMTRKFNPVAFTPGPVTFITTIVYAALLVPLLVVHLVVPQAPSPSSTTGVNLTEAWLDLQILSNGFHPYNSRRNAEVRDWLLGRVEGILSDNSASFSTSRQAYLEHESNSSAIIFDDLRSNLTISSNTFGGPGLTTYFEGNNIIVYIRGSNDPEGAFWHEKKVKGPGGVLVNAHYVGHGLLLFYWPSRLQKEQDRWLLGLFRHHSMRKN